METEKSPSSIEQRIESVVENIEKHLDSISEETSLDPQAPPIQGIVDQLETLETISAESPGDEHDDLINQVVSRVSTQLVVSILERLFYFFTNFSSFRSFINVTVTRRSYV